jgi:3-oxoacyl-(acyl-carrier-protein) synthase
LIYITGKGIISAIGHNAQENYDSLVAGRTGISRVQILSGAGDILTGEVRLTNEQLRDALGITQGLYSRTSLLGMHAAREAWGNNSHLPGLRTGIISATSVGGMDKTEVYYKEVLKNAPADLSLIKTHDSGNTTEKIAAYLGITGYVNTISTACSSAANAIMLGARLLEQGRLDRVVVGGTDAMTLFTIKGFHSLMIYDSEWCKPFDENRNGLNLGEGAAFLVLETERSMQLTGNKPQALVCGWHNAADAYHQTASSPDGRGATIAMQQALKKAKLQSQHISYINAHGTGTKNNDQSESVAIKQVFGDNVPPFSSTKAYTGHTLAAAGAIEAVYSVMAIQHGILFPNLNYKVPITETGLVPVTELSSGRPVNTVVSNSFGFGGNNTSLVFKNL